MRTNIFGTAPRKSSRKMRGLRPAFFVAAELRLLPVAFDQDILAVAMDPVVGHL
jgi:hypothetical protein